MQLDTSEEESDSPGHIQQDQGHDHRQAEIISQRAGAASRACQPCSLQSHQCGHSGRTSYEGRRVSRMTHFFKISLVGVGVVAILAMAALYGLFHGYFDHGEFEIKQFQWSSTNQVAMVAERSDPNEALGGLE